MKQTIKNMHKDLATLLVMKLEGKNIKRFSLFSIFWQHPGTELPFEHPLLCPCL